MTNIRRAFAEFWGGFYNRSTLLPAPVPIPAFQDGYAVQQIMGRPQPPPFPYITYQLARPSFSDFAIVTGRIWNQDKENPGNFGLVDDVLSQAAERIPENGMRLDLGADGTIVLYRSNPFTQYMPPESEDQALVVGLISIVVTNYVI